MTEKNCYNSAISLLTRRDYSSAKLRNKLLEKGFETDLVESVLSTLKQKKFINDQSYTEGRIRHYAKSKKGPAYILKKCLDEGLEITEHEIENIFYELGINYDQVIEYHIRKKLDFHRIRWDELTEKERYNWKIKLMRYVQSKGYNINQIEKYL
ncbi:MAG: regulatory protein RecX [Halobacteriovoraceae bacterium]|nr:regulatory protein RecX [Halobacteriovoraceae bacterium]